MTNKIQYRDPTDTTAYPSPVIWADCPVNEIAHDPSTGFHYYDSFENYVSTATTVINASGYPVFEGDSAIDGVAGSSAGELAVKSTTNNEGASLQVGGTKGAPFVIPADSTGGKLWFEARVKVNDISNDVGQLYIGLAGEAAGTADFGLGGGDIGDFDVLGFLRHEEDGDTFDIITQKTSAGFDTILADAVTLVADTYIKVGFVYEPNGDNAKKIKFYTNGAELTSYVGKASGDATVYLADSTNFPGGEEMSLLVSSHAESADDNIITVDWWRAAQLR
jgi:hypothetical protein